MSAQPSTAADFADRVALVTGAASGMGAASARELARRGAAVIVVDRDSGGAEAVAGEIGAAAPLVGDVSDPAFCTGDDDWRRMFEVNVNGVFYMCRAALGPMRERGQGAIVNFGSIWGDVGATGVLAYCATKGAVHQLTWAMALDCADSGIRVNAVAPGEVDTPMLASGRPSPPTREDLERLADATIPMKRLADPAEIARVVAFLASDAASYMTGAIVPVDASYTTR